MSIIQAITSLFRRLRPTADEIDADHPFSKVRCVFIPRAYPTNTFANLTLVGTESFYGDATYRHLESLTCEAHYPAGTWYPLNDDGSVPATFTYSNIGQLGVAFNDYLNFLIAFRKIYEADLAHPQKVEQLNHLAEQTGAQGHSHASFFEQNGGIFPMLAGCRRAEERAGRVSAEA